MTDAASRRRIEALEIEAETWRVKYEDLRASIGCADEAIYPPAWGLTRTEARLLSLLLERPLAYKPLLRSLLYADRAIGDEPDLKILDVFVCKLRKKIRPIGLAIKTVWGRGWVMDDASKQLARRLIGMSNAPAEAA